MIGGLATSDASLFSALQTAIDLLSSYQELSGKADDKNEMTVLKLLTKLEISGNDLSKMFKSRDMVEVRQKFESPELRAHLCTDSELAKFLAAVFWEHIGMSGLEIDASFG